jgi:hypothetical protein
LNLARMAQAAEPNTPQTATHTPADPAATAVAISAPVRSTNRPA